VPEPRTHYQLSFTSRQALAFFVICLLALGLSYFFGLMTGLSSRRAPKTAADPGSDDAGPADRAGDDAGAHGIPRERAFAHADRGEEATPPSHRQRLRFCRRSRIGERRSRHPGPPRPPRVLRPERAGNLDSGGVLTARREADALVARLSRRGYHAQIAPTPGPKGQLYRVRVGPYRNEEDARRGADKLRRTEKIGEPWIVRDGH
jgi:hypothetical protein